MKLNYIYTKIIKTIQGVPDFAHHSLFIFLSYIYKECCATPGTSCIINKQNRTVYFRKCKIYTELHINTLKLFLAHIEPKEN